MANLHLAGIRSTAVALLAVLVALGLASAQEEPEAKRRLELMQAAVASLEPDAADAKLKAALTPAPSPLLRYSDPTRGGNKEAGTNVLLDASVWRLGSEGRPKALVTVEIYQAPNASRVLAFEFLSLTGTKFSLKHKVEKVRWEPAESALNWKDMPDAPKPAATAAGRLAQMRALARRFAVTERVNNESIECRLMTQPIDRYRSEAEKVADGAIFTFANGTNPEAGVALESDGERWRYGVLRLSAAGLSVTLDGKEVVAFEPFNTRGRTDGSYHNATHPIRRDK